MNLLDLTVAPAIARFGGRRPRGWRRDTWRRMLRAEMRLRRESIYPTEVPI